MMRKGCFVFVRCQCLKMISHGKLWYNVKFESQHLCETGYALLHNEKGKMAPRYNVTLSPEGRAELWGNSFKAKKTARTVRCVRWLLLLDAGGYGPSGRRQLKIAEILQGARSI